jgi:hypothetical protein
MLRQSPGHPQDEAVVVRTSAEIVLEYVNHFRHNNGADDRQHPGPSQGPPPAPTSDEGTVYQTRLKVVATVAVDRTFVADQAALWALHAMVLRIGQ